MSTPRPTPSSSPRPVGIASLLVGLAVLLATPQAWSQLPPAPTPVPGSLLDRPNRTGPLIEDFGTEDGEPGTGSGSAGNGGESPGAPEGAAAKPPARPMQIAFGTAFRVNQTG